MKYHIKVRASAIIIETDRILLVEFDDETGLLVPAGDTRALGDAMERMIVDEQRRKLAGQKALQRAREVFDCDRNTALFADALRSLVTRSDDD